MNREQQQSNREELLRLVRACKHYLMWQREQGWDGVPGGPGLSWGMPRDDEVTRLLLEPVDVSLQVEGRGAHTEHSARRGGDPGRASQSRGHGPEQAASGQAGSGLELIRDAMASLVEHGALPTEEHARHSAGASPASSRQLQRSSREVNVAPAQEVIRVSLEALAQEAPLPLRVLREIDEQELLERQLHWEAMADRWRRCESCTRAHGRSQVVMGEGPLHTRLMLVTEGPSSTQDHEGSFWEGERGGMLKAILRAIGVEPKEVYLTAVVHCFRSQPKVPQAQEIKACSPLLEQEISIVKPEFIIPLGAVATQTLLRETKRLSHLRGAWHQHRDCLIFPTFSPAYLLQRPAYKGLAWEDWQNIRAQLLSSGCRAPSV